MAIDTWVGRVTVTTVTDRSPHAVIATATIPIPRHPRAALAMLAAARGKRSLIAARVTVEAMSSVRLT
jgi:hypothetical protein